MAAISEDLKDIGLKIAKLRGQRNWAQADLAAVMNIDRKTVGAIEGGEADFKISRLISFCKALHVAPSEILPDCLSEIIGLPEGLQKLINMLLQMTPDQRSECLNAMLAMADAFLKVTQCPVNLPKQAKHDR